MDDVRKQFLRQAWAIFGPLKYRILTVFGLIAAVQAASLIGPYIQGTVIDNVMHGKAMAQTYWLIAFSGFVMLLSSWAFQFTREMFEVAKVDFDIDERAGDQTMGQLMKLSVGQHNALHSGMKLSIINRGQSSMTNLVNMFVYEIVPTILRSFAVLIAMCFISPSLGAVAIVAVAIFVGLTFYMNNSFRNNLNILEKKFIQESKFRSEIIQHVSHILINAQGKKAQAEADAKYAEAVDFAKPMWRKFLVYVYTRNLVLTAAKIAILAMGAHYIYTAQYSAGKIVILWYWSNDAFSSVGVVGGLHRQIMRMWSSIRRYCEFLNIESDMLHSSNPVVLDPIVGQIEFRNVEFGYASRVEISADEDEEKDESDEDEEKEKQQALRGISFTIKAGETVAVVGESGSGKTTLANLLVRSNDPSSGEILIDGHDLRSLDLNHFRSRVGVVEQTVPLFDRSMRENILYGMNGHAGDVTEEELKRIAQISQISRFSHKLEKGFDTIIGERGIKLSGGERQRVGIARALVKNPSIMIFDEATSSLDAGVEAEIREAIKDASLGRTTILIAHRFSTIRYAHRIIVMDEGKIVGEGKHEDLYVSCPTYRRLVDHQVVEMGRVS